MCNRCNWCYCCTGIIGECFEEVNVTLADPEKEAKEAGEKKVDDLVKDVTNDKFSGVDEVKKEFEDQKQKSQVFLMV